MALYIDRHNLDSQTPEDVAGAHLRDLETQARYGVNYLTYWYGENNKSLFCLVEAPSKEAASAVHREAHGFVAPDADILEVSYSSIGAYLGKVMDPVVTDTQPENAFRTLLFSGIDDVGSLIQRLGDAAAAQVMSSHDRIVREELESRGGRECARESKGIMGSFPSVVAAVECALAVQRSVAALDSGTNAPVPLRIGVSAGEPVANHGELFGASVLMATALSEAASSGTILASGVVRDLCLGKGFVFEERGELELKGFDERVRVYTVAGKDRPAETPTTSASASYPARLSAREVEVLRLIAGGRTNQEIGDELVISLNTVARHVSNIFDKTGVANRAEAASFAHVHELV